MVKNQHNDVLIITRTFETFIKDVNIKTSKTNYQALECRYIIKKGISGFMDPK